MIIGRGLTPRQHRSAEQYSDNQQRRARDRPLPQPAIGPLDRLAPGGGGADCSFARHHNIPLRHPRQPPSRAPQARPQKPLRAKPATAPPRILRGREHRAACRFWPADRASRELQPRRTRSPARAKSARSVTRFRNPLLWSRRDGEGNAASAMCCRPPTNAASTPTKPFPNSAFTASFARAPPVRGRPPSPSAKTAAGNNTGHRRGRVAAATPIARNSPPLTRM